MSWWIMPWWVISNAALGHVVSRWLQRRKALKKRRSHTALMARIARLELTLGVGLSYAEQWLRAQPARHDSFGYKKCWGCGGAILAPWELSRYGVKRDRPYDPELEARLCSACITKAHATLDVR